MLAILLPLVAVTHTPTFPKSCAQQNLKAEPSQAVYADCAPLTYAVTYKTDDKALVKVYVPKGTPLDDLKVELLGSCDLGDFLDSSDAHTKDEAPGTLIYEPFGESSLVVLKTVERRVSAKDQVCTWRVSKKNENTARVQHVFVVGTKEPMFKLWAIGFPYFLMRITAWHPDTTYVYGYALVSFAALGYAILRKPSGVAIGVLMATAASRWSMASFLGGPTDPGWGLAFGFIPVVLAGGLLVSSNWRWTTVLAVLVIVAPTHTWIDVLVLLWVIYATYQRNDEFEIPIYAWLATRLEGFYQS